MNDAIQISAAATDKDILNGLGDATLQAEAMVFIMSGDEDFGEWREDIRSNYIWSLQTKLSEARALFEAIGRGPAAGGPVGKEGSANA